MVTVLTTSMLSCEIFAGEYAAQSDKTVSVDNKNNWQTAIAEAAFMTGLERNAGVVYMASYAPLFAHVDGWQWTPDLIWVDNLRSYGTPDYYVQKLFSVNKGTDVVSITMNNNIIAGQDSLYATACLDKKTNDLIIKMVNTSYQQKNNTIKLEGTLKASTSASLTVLTSNTLTSMNSFEQPENVAPVTTTITTSGKKINCTAAPYSLSVYRMKLK
jgi:alpha-N-arabinofuranosidase